MLIAILLAATLQIVPGSGCSATDAKAASPLRELFVAAQDGHKETERGAFLTRDADGNLRAVLWPRTMQRRAATFSGTVPRSTVAVAHTHPDGLPQPSAHDIDEAARIGLPIYVVSRTAIARVDPTREVTYLVDNCYWDVILERGGVCRCDRG